MKVFSNFKELIDYVPNCLICGKQLGVHLFGCYAFHNLRFSLKVKDGALVGKYKDRAIAINITDNSIILGQDTINQLMTNWVTVYKKCSTCRCTITTQYAVGYGGTGIIKKHKNFPSLTLKSEEIHFTRKRNKLVSIAQTYYDAPAISTFILINNKTVNPLYMDFNKFKNLNHLNERLSTILTFS